MIRPFLETVGSEGTGAAESSWEGRVTPRGNRHLPSTDWGPVPSSACSYNTVTTVLRDKMILFFF